MCVHQDRYPDADGMETSTDSSQVVSTGNGKASIYMNGVRLEEVNIFIHLIATLYKDGSSTADTLIRTATATAVVMELDDITSVHGGIRNFESRERKGMLLHQI